MRSKTVLHEFDFSSFRFSPLSVLGELFSTLLSFFFGVVTLLLVVGAGIGLLVDVAGRCTVFGVVDVGVVVG